MTDKTVTAAPKIVAGVGNATQSRLAGDRGMAKAIQAALDQAVKDAMAAEISLEDSKTILALKESLRSVARARYNGQPEAEVEKLETAYNELLNKSKLIAAEKRKHARDHERD